MTELGAGTVIASRFQLDGKLGEGGMGEVWAATHVITKKRVALKLLKPEVRDNAAVTQRFLREARAASATRHPNIVAVHDVLVAEGGELVIVMDLLDGEDLGKRLERAGPLSLAEAAAVLLPVVRAIEQMHEAGIVHRDLKPENVFLDRRGDGTLEPKVLDFGIAKLKLEESAEPHALNLTDTGTVMGTPYYMSPEQIFGEKNVDRRSDIWAVGVILWESLSGKRPFDGDNFGQLLKAITVDPLPSLGHVAPHLPVELLALVDRMLVREAAGRLATLTPLIQYLEGRGHSEGAFGPRSSPVDTLTLGASAKTTPNLESARPARRALVLGAFLLPALAATLWWATRSAPVDTALGGSPAGVRPEQPAGSAGPGASSTVAPAPSVSPPTLATASAPKPLESDAGIPAASTVAPIARSGPAVRALKAAASAPPQPARESVPGGVVTTAPF